MTKLSDDDIAELVAYMNKEHWKAIIEDLKTYDDDDWIVDHDPT